MFRSCIILFCLVALGNFSSAQLCPGGGRNFSNAIMFDPAWIYGCNTGSSCNGGVNFDNRPSCEPTIPMDVCAPNPSCGIAAQDASDIWFKFYPSYPNVILACIQNTSMVIGIQAFSAGACGSLTEIGCAKAGGPSSGVQLPLNGLNTGQLYYFRIFGSSHTNPQRSGIYCFCGTQGLQATLLPLSLESLKAVTKGQLVELSILKPASNDEGVYEIEYSHDAIDFQTVYRITKQDLASSGARINYTHSPQTTAAGYYRLKRFVTNGQHYYSSIVKVAFQQRTIQVMYNNLKKEITIQVFQRTSITIADLSGRLLQSASLAPGTHRISTATYAGGIYLAHNSTDNKAYKFLVQE
jgi:hypothetical protein